MVLLNNVLPQLCDEFRICQWTMSPRATHETNLFINYSSGMEFFKRISTDAYENRGILLHEGLRISSWELDLTKRD